MNTMLLFAQTDGPPAGAIIGALFFFLVFGPIVVAIYLIPSIIAWRRGRSDVIPLLIVNVAVGWTFIVWIACLAWSFMPIRERLVGRLPEPRQEI